MNWMVSLRAFYAQFTSEDGRLPVQPYLAATVRYRDALSADTITVEAVAAKDKLNAKYLGILWKALAGKEASFPRKSPHWCVAAVTREGCQHWRPVVAGVGKRIMEDRENRQLPRRVHVATDRR